MEEGRGCAAPAGSILSVTVEKMFRRQMDGDLPVKKAFDSGAAGVEKAVKMDLSPCEAA